MAESHQAMALREQAHHHPHAPLCHRHDGAHPTPVDGELPTAFLVPDVGQVGILPRL
ncbi:hypothetical protein [Bradyrhizobium sp. URHD0069]|uniref:hypothetical protein n=1 Tax=Bradyrhizobium sp. URHD0069 TaxID=1380355 RepID=UPI0018CC45D0|nr:hypothetical protein [Bradyrhizobium sp. URHD0069]